MTRVPFEVSSSPFLLSGTIQHLKNVAATKNIAEKMRSSFYVDDILMGADTVEEAITLYETSNSIMKDAGMNLRKWASNDKHVQHIMNEAEADAVPADRNLKLSRISKVLGMISGKDSDSFKFSVDSFTSFLQTKVDTKRSILQAASRIFDPMGFIAPFTIRAKLLFQKLWKLGVNWDEEIPEELYVEWSNWCRDIPNIYAVHVPRHIKNGQKKTV